MFRIRRRSIYMQGIENEAILCLLQLMQEEHHRDT